MIRPRSFAELMTFMAPLTDNTVTDPQELQQRLVAIRDQGYAVTQGELDPGALGVAAPVRDEYDRVVAGLSVIAPGQRAP